MFIGKVHFGDISNKLYDLKINIEEQMAKANKTMNFKYGFYSSDIKKQIDDVSRLILNSSKDCKNEFNKYVLNFLETEKLKGEYVLTNRKDEIRVKATAKDKMYEIMGNQILQFMKENIIENKNENWERIKEEKHEEYKNKQLEYAVQNNINDKYYNELRQKNEVRSLMGSIAGNMGSHNTAMNARKSSLKKSFSNMTKEEIRQKMKEKANSSGFDWFEEN